MRLIKFLRIVPAVIFMLAALLTYDYASNQGDASSATEIIRSQILKEERTISIVLPRGYQSGDDHYPVLYFLDAEAQIGFLKECSSIQELSSKGVFPPVIVIGIWNEEGLRNRDMIPEAVTHRPGSGGSQEFLHFIREELMTHVRDKYRTQDTSILYGASNAGLFTVFALLEDAEVFDACIAASPMIGHCPEFIQQLAEQFVVRIPKKNKLLYMIYGSEDSARVTDFVPRFQEYLEENAPAGFKSYHVICEGEGHVPPRSLEQGLLFISNYLIRE